VQLITLKGGALKEETLKENVSSDATKLYPTDIGSVVNRFLLEFFNNIIDYNFTANVEKEFDDIAEGKKEWNQMIKEFYGPFHHKIEDTEEKSGKFTGERLLGQDPETGKNVYSKVGRFGPIVQIGDTEAEEKPKFAGLRNGLSLETITLEQALGLFDFPRILGEFEGEEVSVAIGRYGPYVKHNKKFYSLSKTDDPSVINLERAIEIMAEKRTVDQKKVIKEFEEDKDVQVLNGRYGAYLVIKKQNYKIPKDYDPAKLTLEECYAISKDPKNMPKKRYARRKK
jgi:DNA topoisomerase-1